MVLLRILFPFCTLRENTYLSPWNSWFRDRRLEQEVLLLLGWQLSEPHLIRDMANVFHQQKTDSSHITLNSAISDHCYDVSAKGANCTARTRRQSSPSLTPTVFGAETVSAPSESSNRATQVMEVCLKNEHREARLTEKNVTAFTVSVRLLYLCYRKVMANLYDVCCQINLKDIVT